MTAAAASMALAPIAAQANTRAGDSSAIYSSSAFSQPGVDRAADGEDIVGTSGIFIIVFVTATIIGIILIADDDNDDDNNQSPGAN
ncbi:hypothetical protein [Erythrobacter sp. JK5]|uniref:hypothetical protein n=1 Tax=Erythrobacter sp. JK5 TaxID=2829500 RepID=UPI001BA68756|nr:hypothetical protein [Erythrobacter sp. JK5]QUL37651.1 hypothetical protein KDC96_15100 [Erythrobacter sp. JK5]